MISTPVPIRSPEGGLVLDAADTRSLALLYHLNSEPSLNLEAYEEGYESHAKVIARSGESIALPDTDGGSAVFQAIRRRKSCRAFAPTPLALTDLAEILAGTYGPSRPIALGSGIELQARSVPSAGALYPLELYVVLQRVADVDDGLYRYDVLGHALEPVGAGLDRRVLAEAFLGPFFLENANALVLVTAVFDRTLHKYGARGYRYILLEAGHVAQNLCLLATERGLASLCVGGFMDGAVNRALDLEPRTEATVYCVGIGHSGDG